MAVKISPTKYSCNILKWLDREIIYGYGTDKNCMPASKHKVKYSLLTTNITFTSVVSHGDGGMDGCLHVYVHVVCFLACMHIRKHAYNYKHA